MVDEILKSIGGPRVKLATVCFGVNDAAGPASDV